MSGWGSLACVLVQGVVQPELCSVKGQFQSMLARGTVRTPANGVKVHQSHLAWRQVAANVSITPLEH